MRIYCYCYRLINSSIEYIQNATNFCYPLGYAETNGCRWFELWDYTVPTSQTFTVVQFIHCGKVKGGLTLTHIDGSVVTLSSYDVPADQLIPKSEIVKTFYAEQGSVLHLYVDEATTNSGNTAAVIPILIW